MFWFRLDGACGNGVCRRCVARRFAEKSRNGRLWRERLECEGGRKHGNKRGESLFVRPHKSESHAWTRPLAVKPFSEGFFATPTTCGEEMSPLVNLVLENSFVLSTKEAHWERLLRSHLTKLERPY